MAIVVSEGQKDSEARSPTYWVEQHRFPKKAEATPFMRSVHGKHTNPGAGALVEVAFAVALHGVIRDDHVDPTRPNSGSPTNPPLCGACCG